MFAATLGLSGAKKKPARKRNHGEESLRDGSRAGCGIAACIAVGGTLDGRRGPSHAPSAQRFRTGVASLAWPARLLVFLATCHARSGREIHRVRGGHAGRWFF